MKRIAFILSVYFMVISSQPIFMGLSKLAGGCPIAMSGGCCKKEAVKQEHKGKLPLNQKQENNCPLCCSISFQNVFCCGTLVEESVFGIVLPSKAALFPNTDLILHSSYSSDCWQPPELV